jgi:NAD(P)H-flavin reductase
MSKPRDCRARVSAVRRLTPDILEADLAMEEPPALDFQAGPWVSIPFGPKTVRAYSIASTPQSPRRITLSADVTPGGIGSQWFRALKAGDEVRFKGPLGGFVFARADSRRPFFVAEEIGIVPIRSMLAELHETGTGRPVTLVYWVRDPGWLVYDVDFRSLAERDPAFAYHPVVGDAPAGWTGQRGDVAEAVSRLASDVASLVVYASGGGAMINRVRDVLMAKGLERKAVKWEKFW